MCDGRKASVVDALDAILSDLLAARGAARVPVPDLVSRLLSANAALHNCDQDAALDAAKQAGLQSSHCLPLLRRAALEDADDETGLVAAASDLVNILSGQGTHTYSFEPVPSVHLRLLYTPQATGTHGRIWRAAHMLVGACVSGWADVHVKDARVLELGCGTGAAGLACALLGATETWLTDVDDGALSLARSNAALNGLEGTTTVRPLDVMEPTPVDEPRFEVILVADCPYDFVEPAKLVEAIAQRLATSPSARALVVQDGDTRRSERHQHGIAESIALAACHPALRCVASEERQVQVDTEAEGDLDLHPGMGGRHVVLMHAYAPRQVEVGKT